MTECPAVCPVCRGSGRVGQPLPYDLARWAPSTACTVCRGSGLHPDMPLPAMPLELVAVVEAEALRFHVIDAIAADEGEG